MIPIQYACVIDVIRSLFFSGHILKVVINRDGKQFILINWFIYDMVSLTEYATFNVDYIIVKGGNTFLGFLRKVFNNLDGMKILNGRWHVVIFELFI